jgi:hypothetical protein
VAVVIPLKLVYTPVDATVTAIRNYQVPSTKLHLDAHTYTEETQAGGIGFRVTYPVVVLNTERIRGHLSRGGSESRTFPSKVTRGLHPAPP